MRVNARFLGLLIWCVLRWLFGESRQTDAVPREGLLLICRLLLHAEPHSGSRFYIPCFACTLDDTTPTSTEW